MLYIVNFQPYTFLFMNRFKEKSGLLNMIIFFCFILLIDSEYVILLYFVLSCRLWSFWSWSFWSNSKSDEKKSSKDSIYK